MKYLSLKQILLIHSILIDETSGAHGVREMVRLKSVVETPKQRFYKDPFEKSAVYMRGIIQDHPFIDGNKRSGITTAIIFLEMNDIHVDFKLTEIEEFAVRVAIDRSGIDEIAHWLASHRVE